MVAGHDDDRYLSAIARGLILMAGVFVCAMIAGAWLALGWWAL